MMRPASTFLPIRMFRSRSVGGIAGNKMKRRVLPDLFKRDKLKRIFLFDRGRNLGQVECRIA